MPRLKDSKMNKHWRRLSDKIWYDNFNNKVSKDSLKWPGHILEKKGKVRYAEKSTIFLI